MNALRGLGRMAAVSVMFGVVALAAYSVWQVKFFIPYDPKLSSIIVLGCAVIALIGGLVLYLAISVLDSMGQPEEKKP